MRGPTKIRDHIAPSDITEAWIIPMQITQEIEELESEHGRRRDVHYEDGVPDWNELREYGVTLLIHRRWYF